MHASGAQVRPPVIGLVGGIGSGKSTVAGILRELGCVVADSDHYARQALCEPAIRQRIIEWWGEDVLDPQTHEVDRRKLAPIVFADAEQRRRLEGLTHPWIEARRRELFASAPPETKALVIDAPLLLEAGLDRECDAIIFIDTPAEVRARRVASTRGWSEDQLHAREKAQMPLDEKRRISDHVLVNGGDLEQLRDAVARTLEQIVKRRP
jgi:dephospho-CoA kinase